MGQAIVFDLDGTLIDTAPDLYAGIAWLLERAGRPPVPFREIGELVGDGARRMIERAFERTGEIPDEATLDRLLADYLGYYGAHLAIHSAPYPGLVPCLERLSARGAVLGVCTNKPHLLSLDLLRALDLERHFSAVLGGDSLAVRKPDPGHLMATLQAMGAAAADAVMVGDSANDVGAARALGVPVIVVSFGYATGPTSDLGGDLVIDHFDELDGAIDRLRQAATDKLGGGR